jgi:hypothetical protein
MTSDSTRRAMALAAAAGLGLGLQACNKGGDGAAEGTSASSATQGMSSAMVAAETKDKNCCIGKNDCKGKGGCAVPESHSCAGKNDCKGKGGCNMHCPK